ncbi:energy-coupling factor transporter transmembrane component T family protein [Nakamurella sp. GG22]
MTPGFPGHRQIADSPLARANPVAKLLVLGAVSVTSLFILDPVTPLLLYALAVLGVRVGARVPLRTLARAQWPFLPFAAGVLMVNAVSRPGQVVWQSGFIRVSQEGLAVGASLAVRVLLIGALSIGFLSTTDPVRLMTSLRMQLRVSPRFAYALLAGHRVLLQLPGEWEQLRYAHQVRSPLTRTGRPRRPIRFWGRCAFGLLVVTIRRGDRLAQALESRGLGLTPRTCWQPEIIRRADIGLVAVVIAGCAAAVAVSAAVGTLQGIGALFS